MMAFAYKETYTTRGDLSIKHLYRPSDDHEPCMRRKRKVVKTENPQMIASRRWTASTLNDEPPTPITIRVMAKSPTTAVPYEVSPIT